MKIRALFADFDLTKGKIYRVISEYTTVYELQCDTGRHFKDKELFEIVEENKREF